MNLTRHYLVSADAFYSKRATALSLTIILLWCIVVLVGIAHHEFWRDEVNLLTVAIKPDSVLGLFAEIRDVGHPLAWYLLLRFIHNIVQSPVALPIASMAVALGGVLAFVALSPFANWQKILFIFGVFPLYQYSVMARGNYGLAMPLLFLFAHYYRSRNNNPLILATLLFLLANTSAHACLIAAVLTLIWIVEYWLSERRKIAVHLASFSIVAIGGLIALVTTLPPTDTVVTNAVSSGIGLVETLRMALSHLLRPAASFPEIWGGSASFWMELAFWGLVAGLLVRPTRSIGLTLGAIILALFFSLVTHSHIRHQGMLYLLIITLFWMTLAETGAVTTWPARLHRRVTSIGLGALLLVHASLGAQAIRGEITGKLSSVKDLAEYIKTSAPHAVLVPEPAYIMEAAPYYIDNEMFFVREKKYAKRAAYTFHRLKHLSLDQLLQSARELQLKREKSVLIVLGHLNLESRDTHEIEFPFAKVFTWSDDSLAYFNDHTEKVAEFTRSAGPERFEVYRLRERKESQ